MYMNVVIIKLHTQMYSESIFTEPGFWSIKYAKIHKK